jgi:hypothetical protein
LRRGGSLRCQLCFVGARDLDRLRSELFGFDGVGFRLRRHLPDEHLRLGVGRRGFARRHDIEVAGARSRAVRCIRRRRKLLRHHRDAAVRLGRADVISADRVLRDKEANQPDAEERANYARFHSPTARHHHSPLT